MHRTVLTLALLLAACGLSLIAQTPSTNTAQQVQGFSAEDVSKDTHVYEPVRCIACQYLHHVNPATGVVLDDKIRPLR